MSDLNVEHIMILGTCIINCLISMLLYYELVTRGQNGK